MEIMRTVSALVAMVSLLGACGGATAPRESSRDQTTTTSSADSATTPTVEWTGRTIPDGTYLKTVTMADARKVGLPRDRAAVILGRDGEWRLELRVAGDTFAQFGDDGDGPLTQGDGGTATYDEDGHWVTTSNSPGCPGCVATVDWSVEGDRLTLRIIETTEVGDPVDLLIGRLVYEGTWTLR